MTLGARRSRLLGAIWILAGLGLTAAAVLLWLDRQTVSVWELPLAIVALGVGAWLWSQRVTIDRHGITLSSLTRTQRILWAGIDSVEVQATWWRPALTINRKGDGSATTVRTTSGLTSSQRSELFDVLHELAREHGFAIRRKGFGKLASATDHLDGDVQGAAGLELLDPPAGVDDASRDVTEGVAEEPASLATSPGDDAVAAADDEADDDVATHDSDAIVGLDDDADDDVDVAAHGGDDVDSRVPEGELGDDTTAGRDDEGIEAASATRDDATERTDADATVAIDPVVLDAMDDDGGHAEPVEVRESASDGDAGDSAGTPGDVDGDHEDADDADVAGKPGARDGAPADPDDTDEVTVVVEPSADDGLSADPDDTDEVTVVIERSADDGSGDKETAPRP